VLVVGHGEAGKTTLVRRIQSGSFQAGYSMTDGIIMSEVSLGDLETTFLDFGGQDEYEYTNGLFLKEPDAVILVVHNPRSDNLLRSEEFLHTVENKAAGAPVILVTTRASETVLRKDEALEVRRNHPAITDIIAVDSKHGRGFDKLKQALVAAALQLPRTTTSVPKKFNALLNKLKELRAQEFSVSFEMFISVAATFDIDGESAQVAKELFCHWGMLFELFNGDLVLNPQQLADVLACVFTKDKGKVAKMGDIGRGILHHQKVILKVVWSAFPKSLWSTATAATPPFIKLLHMAELGYPLYGPTGNPLNATFIPALLPDKPLGFPDSQALTELGLANFFLQGGYSSLVRHSTLKLTLVAPQPAQTFIAQLIVRLRHHTMLDGVFKKGAVIEVDDRRPERKSMCIFYADKDAHQISVVSPGTRGDSLTARALFLAEFIKLVTEHYPSMKIRELVFGKQIVNGFDVSELLANHNGYIVDSISGDRLSLVELSPLFLVDTSFAKLQSKTLPASNSEATPNADPSFEALSSCVQKLMCGSQEELNGDDFVKLSYQLQAAIPFIVQLQQLPRLKRECVHCLWAVFRSTDTNTTAVFAITCGVKFEGIWKMVLASEIALDDQKLPGKQSSDMQRTEVAERIIGQALKLVKLRCPSRWVFDGLRFPRDFAGDILFKESQLFVPLDDASDNIYVLKEDHSQALASRIRDISNLTSSTVDGIASIGQQLHSVEHQVKETSVAVKVVHEEVIGLRADISRRLLSMESIMRSLPADVADELGKNWQDKLKDVESAIETKNARRIGVHLTTLSSESRKIAKNDNLSELLTSFKEEIVGLITKSSASNEEEYRRQSGLLIQGLRKVQARLDTQAVTLERIEQGVQKNYISMDSGVREIQQSLQSNANDLEDLKLLHSSWKACVGTIEEFMESKNSASMGTAFDDLKEYFESYAGDLEKSLRDSIGKEFDDMKRKVFEGDGRVLAELRAVQAQLTEVLTLGKETRDKLAQGLKMLQATVVNVNQRTCPTLFIMSVPEEKEEKKEKAAPAKKGTRSSMAAVIGKAKKLYAFATDSSVRHEMLYDSLNLTLVCELCHQPQPDPYKVSTPREFLVKMLPLAKVGIKVVCGLNAISKLGRLFGLPSPVIDKEDMDAAKEFVDAVGKSTLDDYKELQERARLEAGAAGLQAGEEQSMGEGYCAREFRRFLQAVDPKEQWSGLAAKVTPDGFVFFACAECCAGKN
jgi:hypothetical protein